MEAAVPALDVLPPDLSHDVALASQVLVTQAQEVVDHEGLVTVPHLGWLDQQEAGGRRQEAGDRRQEAGGRRQEAGGRDRRQGQVTGGRRQGGKEHG